MRNQISLNAVLKSFTIIVISVFLILGFQACKKEKAEFPDGMKLELELQYPIKQPVLMPNGNFCFTFNSSLYCVNSKGWEVWNSVFNFPTYYMPEGSSINQNYILCLGKYNYNELLATAIDNNNKELWRYYFLPVNGYIYPNAAAVLQDGSSVINASGSEGAISSASWLIRLGMEGKLIKKTLFIGDSMKTDNMCSADQNCFLINANGSVRKLDTTYRQLWSISTSGINDAKIKNAGEGWMLFGYGVDSIPVVRGYNFDGQQQWSIQYEALKGYSINDVLEDCNELIVTGATTTANGQDYHMYFVRSTKEGVLLVKKELRLSDRSIGNFIFKTGEKYLIFTTKFDYHDNWLFGPNHYYKPYFSSISLDKNGKGCNKNKCF